MRFLHLADVHLDTPFAGRTDGLRRRLREASREALQRALDAAIELQLDAVLIAGDLFDGPRLSFASERFLVEALTSADAAGLQVIYATGNHDPGHASLRAHRLPWPDRIVVVTGRDPRRVAVERDGRTVGWVTAAGHESHRESTDLSQAFRRPAGSLPEVAMLHTQVRDAFRSRDHDAYAPSELWRLKAAGFDYWALGHVHERQQLSDAPPIHYPGNIQGRTHKEAGPRGGLIVDLGDRLAPTVEFRDFAPVRWETVEVADLMSVDSLERLVHQVQLAWNDHLSSTLDGRASEWMIRIRLAGPCPLWRVLRLREEARTLEEELAAILGALDVTVETSALYPPVSVDRHRDREDTLGEALRLLEAIQSGESLPGIDPNQLAGFENREGQDVQAYIRALLADADGEVLTRLLVQED